MRDYYELTVRGRARRLRELVGIALKHYDFDVARVRLITNETNGIFRLDTAGGDKYVMRVGLGGEIAHSAATVSSETEWIAALAADTDLTVPTPFPARDGHRFVTVEAPGVPDPRNVVLFSWLSGQLLSDRLTSDTMRAYGELAARLHLHGAQHRPTDPEALARYDRVNPFDEPMVLFDDDAQLIPPARRAVFEAARAQVENALGELGRSGEPMRVLHGDLHIWNVMVSRVGLAPFDFEDLMWGWPIQDIATSLYYLQTEPDFDRRISEFRSGYESVAEWPERYPGEMKTFVAGRCLVLANDLLITPEWRPEAEKYLSRYEQRLPGLLGAS